MTGWAIISEDEKFRYALGRVWDDTLPVLVFLMLNPSTADALKPDRTITRCVGFARRWGFGGILVLNLWAFRTAYPEELAATGYPVGPENDEHLRYFAQAARDTGSDVIVAWGRNAQGCAVARDRRAEVVEMLVHHELWCIETTKDGEPSHPLMLRNDAVPFLWGGA